MNFKEVYPAIQSASHSLSSFYLPAIEASGSSAGLEPHEIWILVAVPTFEPGEVNSTLLGIRNPYTSNSRLEEILVSLKVKHLLLSLDGVNYRKTDRGSVVCNALIKSAYEAMSGIQPVPVTDMMDLASRLKEISETCLASAEPPGKWCIMHTHALDPGSGASVMARIDQFLSELIAFRDDAHLDTWRAYGVNGHAWEILTILWNQKMLPIDKINTKLAHRGFTQPETQSAVDSLSKKGWVLSTKGEVRISPFGEEIRKIAEETTDRYYFGPWKKYSEKELEELINLLDQFRRGLPKTEKGIN